MQKNIQLIFTKIRKELNTREDKLLSKTEEQFNKLYFNEDIINISNFRANVGAFEMLSTSKFVSIKINN